MVKDVTVEAQEVEGEVRRNNHIKETVQLVSPVESTSPFVTPNTTPAAKPSTKPTTAPSTPSPTLPFPQLWGSPPFPYDKVSAIVETLLPKCYQNSVPQMAAPKNSHFVP